MLFTIIKMGLKGKSFYKDPKNFASGAVMGTAMSFLIVPIITCIGILGLLFILSFTHLLGGPFGLAKVFFWICAIGYFIMAIPVYAFYKIAKKMSGKAGSAAEKIFVASQIKE